MNISHNAPYYFVLLSTHFFLSIIIPNTIVYKFKHNK